MTHKTQVSLQIPDLQELCCINCRVNYEAIQHPIIKSLFHCQILTCRLIINSARCCIASPSIQNVVDLIHVIVSKEFHLTGKLQEHLQNLKIQFSDPESVHPRIYEACLKYTFTFKISPYWSLIGKSYYIHDCNFMSLSNADAVDWDILFKEDNAKLELKPIKLNLFPLTPELLGVSSNIANNLKKNTICTIDSINLTLLQCPPIYVLPKLTKGKVVSISTKIPESCPFENYNDLRRHWKNMYSYRLPKNDKEMLFYQVVFPINPNQQFTYPEVCIFFKMPELCTCNNRNEIASRFIKDFCTGIRSVCGVPIKISQLFPKLDMEYSCILQSYNYNEQNNNQIKSPFFKTHRNYIVKPSNEKLNLSSIFTFKGMDKMNETMKIHSQKVLSIMGANKKRKLTEIEDKTLNLNTINCRGKKSRNYSHSSAENLSSANYENTITYNTDDIFSYYDIPSMRSDYLASINKNQNFGINQDERFSQCNFENLSSIESINNTTHLNQNSMLKPVIKNIENACFDLTNIRINKAMNAVDNSNINHQQKLNFKACIKNNCQNSLQKINQSIFGSSSYKISQENFFTENLKTDDVQDICKQKLISDNHLCNELYNVSSSINEDTRQNEMFKEKSRNNEEFGINNISIKKKDIVETTELRCLLSSFDSYNLHGKDNLETMFYNQYYHENKIKSGQLDKSFHESSEKTISEFPIQHFDNSSAQNSLKKSPSWLNNIRNQNEFFVNKQIKVKNCDECYLKQHNPNGKSNNFFQDKISLFQTKSFKTIINEERETSSQLNEKETGKNVCMDDKSHYLQHLLRETGKCNVNNEKGKLNKSPYPPSTLEKSEKSEKATLQEFEGLDKNLQEYTPSNMNLNKTPSSISTITNTELKYSCLSQNTQEFSIDISNSYNENKNSSQKFEIDHLFNKELNKSNEILDLSFELQKYNSDFHSVLSQSSNESDSANHESYKLTCIEALTFNN